MRAVRGCECAGVAGMRIEGQELREKCWHFERERRYRRVKRMDKVKGALDASEELGFVVIALVDVSALLGIDEVMKRAERLMWK